MSTKIFIIGVLISASANAQKTESPDKAPVDLSLLRQQLYEPDSAAPGVILFDMGECISDPYRGTKFSRKRRIKIYKKDAMNEWADFRVQLDEAAILKFSATIYNENNGQIVTSSLDYKSLLKDKSKNSGVGAVAIPDIKDGSVLEYSYIVRLDGYGLMDWQFQYSIPVIWSEYELIFAGSFFGVKATISGVLEVNKSIRNEGKHRKYWIKNIPAFKGEPLMPVADYYISSITFRQSFSSDDFEEQYSLKELAKSGIRRDSLMLDTKIVAQGNFSVNSSGSLVGKVIINKYGFDALIAREMIRELGVTKYLRNEADELNWNVTTSSLENFEDKGKPLVTKYELTIENYLIIADSFLYINPCFVLREDENPFKAESRQYPIDLGSRTERLLSMVLKIPDGYVVDELPANSVLELPEKDGSFITSVNQVGNEIHATTRLRINKIVFNVNEYPVLREFFNRLVAKESQLIVLRKQFVR